MTDELRRWSEEGASTSELELLASARAEKPSSASRTRIASALGVGAALTTTTTAAATSGGISLAAKVGSAVVLVGATTFGVFQISREKPVDPPAVVAAPPPAPVAVVESPTPRPSSEPAVVAPPGESSKPEVRPRSFASSAPSTGDNLGKELAALERARKALAGDSPDKALAELDKYGKRFPKGELASERTVLQVQALLARGKRDEAVALANQFAAAHPDSPYSKRVLALVKNPKPKH